MKKKSPKNSRKSPGCSVASPKKRIHITERKTVEERREYLASFPQLNPNPILEVNTSREVIFSNASTQRILRELEIEKMNVAVFLPSDIDIILEELKKNKELSFYREVAVKNRLFAETVYLAPQFQVARIYGFDITPRLHAEEALQKSEQRLKFHFENSPLAVVEWDSDFVVTQWSNEAARIFGWKAGEMIGKRIDTLNMIYVEDIPIVNRTMERLTSGKENTVVSSNRNYTKSGEVIECIWYNSILLDDKGAMASVMSLVDDITVRKKAEKSLRESEKKLAVDLDAMTRLNKLGTLFVREGNLEPVLSEIVDAAIAISGADFGNIQLLDSKSQELKIVSQRGFPKWWIDFWDSVSKGRGTCGTALERGERVIVEDIEQSTIFTGTPALDVQLRASIRAVQSTPLTSRSGKPLGMFSTHYKTPHRPDDRSLQLLDLLARHAADIIEHAQTEEALRKSAEQFHSLADSIPNLAWWANGDGYITWYNQRWYDYTGTTPEQMEGWGWQSVHDPEVLPKVLERWKASIATGEPFDMEFPLRGVDGIFRPFLTRVMPLKDSAGKVIQWFGTNTDVSERKKAEEELKQSESRYRALFDNMIEGFAYCKVLFDDSGRPVDFVYLEVNSSFAKLTGLTDVVGKKVTEVIPGIRETDPELFQVYGRVSLSGKPERLEFYVEALKMWFSLSVYCPEKEYFVAVFDVITERKRAEHILESRLRIAEAAYKGVLSASEILRMTLDEIEAQTGSKIGFYHYLEDDQKTLSLQGWSTNTISSMCKAGGAGSHYSIAQAGVWVDCVREKRPVIHNDYPSLPNRKGMPAGHPPLLREMVVPIFRGNRIVAIIGVGNKETGYTESDIKIATYLGDFSWEIIDRMRADEEKTRHAEELRNANEELVRFNRVAIGRELRMIELKKEVNALRSRIGEAPLYPLDFKDQ